MVALDFLRCEIIILPADTNISLLAIKIVLLLLMALITGCMHEKPTIAAMIVVTFISDEMMSKPSLPNNICVLPIKAPYDFIKVSNYP